MKTYRIKYRTGERGVRFVQASVLDVRDDCYVFMNDREIVAVVSKESATSVELVENDGSSA